MVEVLLHKIKNHSDQAAFRQLYQLLFFRLYQFAFVYVKSKENAEEIVNDVFLRLWLKKDALGSIANINVYLYTAVKNAALNHLRDNKMIFLSQSELKTDHFHLAVNPESLFITEELQKQVRNAIEQLPGRCKLIFKLVKEDGLSYKEVAKILDISVKTVDAQLYLALKKLSRLLLPVWKEYTHQQAMRPVKSP